MAHGPNLVYVLFFYINFLNCGKIDITLMIVTMFKRIVQGHWAHSLCHVTVTTFTSGIFSSSQTETQSLLNTSSPSPSPGPGHPPSAFCFCEFDNSSCLSGIICPFVTGLFPLT